jgi:hypothetical protein
MSIIRDIYILRVSCILYAICSVSLLLILSVFSGYYSDTYVKLISTSLIGPINVMINGVTHTGNNCIYNIYYYVNGLEYYNFYDFSCEFQYHKEKYGFYEPKNPWLIYLDRNQLECEEIKDCNYYLEMSNTLKISNIILGIFNMIIISTIFLCIYRLEGLRNYQPTYPDNSIVNPLHIVIDR